jgi:transcriptional regulator GlxA family with amidase domain
MKPFLIATVAALALAASAIPPAVTAGPLVSPAAAVPQDRLILPPPKPGHSRPLVAVVADSAGAETADLVVPFGVLRESGLAEVRTVATAPGPVQLFRAIRIQPDQTLAQFDRAAPEGADIVIVPAQKRPDSPALTAWLRAQAAKGATVVSICEGARVLAAADLLAGKRVTTHWHALSDLERSHPEATWVRDRRYVQDGRIISTTGVAAALPVSLALVEAIGGPQAARDVADRLGAGSWSAAHRTADFGLGPGDYARIVLTILAFWTHEKVEAPVADGVDEIALALRADAWARSFRGEVLTTRAGRAPVRSRRGLVILPDAEPSGGRRYVLQASEVRPAGQLKVTLPAMSRRYGPAAARLATTTLEADPAETGTAVARLARRGD